MHLCSSCEHTTTAYFLPTCDAWESAYDDAGNWRGAPPSLDECAVKGTQLPFVDMKELLDAIATQDYGVSDDRSAKLATPAIKAYNAVADKYHQALQKRGQPLHEGFTLVKVRAARWACGDRTRCACMCSRC